MLQNEVIDESLPAGELQRPRTPGATGWRAVEAS